MKPNKTFLHNTLMSTLSKPFSTNDKSQYVAQQRHFNYGHKGSHRKRDHSTKRYSSSPSDDTKSDDRLKKHDFYYYYMPKEEMKKKMESKRKQQMQNSDTERLGHTDAKAGNLGIECDNKNVPKEVNNMRKHKHRDSNRSYGNKKYKKHKRSNDKYLLSSNDSDKSNKQDIDDVGSSGTKSKKSSRKRKKRHKERKSKLFSDSSGTVYSKQKSTYDYIDVRHADGGAGGYSSKEYREKDIPYSGKKKHKKHKGKTHKNSPTDSEVESFDSWDASVGKRQQSRKDRGCESEDLVEDDYYHTSGAHSHRGSSCGSRARHTSHY